MAQSLGLGPDLASCPHGFLLWAAVLAFAVLLARWLAGPSAPRKRRPLNSSALKILEERFARGEISIDAPGAPTSSRARRTHFRRDSDRRAIVNIFLLDATHCAI